MDIKKINSFVPIKGKYSRKIFWFLFLYELFTLSFYIFNSVIIVVNGGALPDILGYHYQMWETIFATRTLSQTLILGLPIVLVAVGAAFNERSGVINIGVEGVMLVGAWGSVYFTWVFNNPFIGVLGGILISGLTGLVHAFFTVTLKSEQIVTGVAINLIALGLTNTLTTLIWRPGRSDPITTLPIIDIYSLPVLGPYIGLLRFSRYFGVPVLGDILKLIPDPLELINGHSFLIYFAVLLLPLANIFLFKTNIGLRIRSIGESPHTAATAGIPVRKYQYFAVILSAMFAGLGGTVLAMETGLFQENMTLGQGFIGLVAMIFGNWTILGAIAAGFFFGYFYAISIALPTTPGLLDSSVPGPLIRSLPFLIALFALAGFMGKTRPPKAIGKAYDPQEE